MAIVACGLLVALEALTAQAPRSLWDGVYTQDQAKRGEAVYVEKCARCHGAQLIGGDMNPPLARSGVSFNMEHQDSSAIYLTGFAPPCRQTNREA